MLRYATQTLWVVLSEFNLTGLKNITGNKFEGWKTHG